MCSTDYLTKVYNRPMLADVDRNNCHCMKSLCVLLNDISYTLKATCTCETNVANNVVTTMKEVRVRWSAIRFLVGAGDFPILRDVQTGSVVSLG
jgi:hypothetical protein